MRSSPLLAALATVAPAVAVPIVPEAGIQLVSIANITAKVLSDNKYSFDLDVVDNTREGSVHCSNTWANDDATPAAAACADATYSFTVRYPNDQPSVQTFNALVGVEGQGNWWQAYVATGATGSPDYTCGHSGEEGVLSKCFSNLWISVAPVAPILPAPTVNPEIELTNISAKTLDNYNLVFEFDVVDNTNNETAHCSNQWINGDRMVVANACTNTGSSTYSSTIDFTNGFNIQTWTAYITKDEKSDPGYKADVKTGTPDYTCGSSGTEGVRSACFTGAGVKIATSRWSIWGSV
ncbi:hypothetical protein CPLU01_12897 [Colletotrichum plurivorum]|uniref:AA1-like domain-containing protein n=1 Tax=Colletotrichum plurivorum TaxID=2175906 RepID=A0A8H6JW58_9PEZI|nr:hypothetical protein CPLU01_12897 [Colletotrichum plurivorum]